jgi:hypothetical protein
MNRQERREANARVRSKEFRRKHGIKVKRGRRPLLKDDQRFEMALWLLFTEAGLPKYRAAYLAMLLIGPVDIAAAETIEDLLIVIRGTRHRYATDLEHRAERIRDKVCETIGRGVEAEVGWLSNSAAFLTIALSNLSAPSTGCAVKELEALGWSNALRMIGDRWTKATRSNFPPHTERLSRAAQALYTYLKTINAQKGLCGAGIADCGAPTTAPP